MQLLPWLGVTPFVDGGELSLAYVATLSLLDTALLIALILWFLRQRGESARDLFFGTRLVIGEARLGVLLVPLVVATVIGAFVAIQRFAPWLHNVTVNPLEALIQTPSDAWVFGIVAVVAGGIREELQRAFILKRFEQHLGGAIVGLIVFSLAFGAGHVIQGWDAALITALLGGIWGVVYLWRRSIVAPVVSHSCFNVVEILRHLAG